MLLSITICGCENANSRKEKQIQELPKQWVSTPTYKSEKEKKLENIYHNFTSGRLTIDECRQMVRDVESEYSIDYNQNSVSVIDDMMSNGMEKEADDALQRIENMKKVNADGWVNVNLESLDSNKKGKK